MNLPYHALEIGFHLTTRVTYAIKYFERSSMAKVGRSNSVYTTKVLEYSNF